jgi:hypothetical protein
MISDILCVPCLKWVDWTYVASVEEGKSSWITSSSLFVWRRLWNILRYRVFRAQADWTLTHTSTIEASITLDGVTLTDSLIRWSPNEWPSVCREIPQCLPVRCSGRLLCLHNEHTILSQNSNSETEEKHEQFLFRTNIQTGFIPNDNFKCYQ